MSGHRAPARVLVTGAAGFIGSHVVDELLGAGASVLGVDDLSTGQRINLEDAGRSPSFDLAVLDIASPDAPSAVAQLVSRFAPDVVVHLAAAIDVRRSVADPVGDARVNVLGTLAVLDAARLAGVRRVVFMSSGGALYDTRGPLPATETAPVLAGSPYAASKAAAELWLALYEREHGISWTALAPANVYGPRQSPLGEGGVVSIFGGRLLRGQPVTIYGDGRQTRDFVFVSDIAAAVLAAASRDGVGRVNLGTGSETSVLELYSALAREAGTAPSEPVFASARAGEVLRSSLDASRAAHVLGWSPRVPLGDGLARTMRWLRESAQAHPADLPS